MSTSELSPLLNTNDVESLGAPNHGNNNKAPGLMDNVAKLGSIALAVFGVLAYLGWGLSLGFAEVSLSIVFMISSLLYHLDFYLMTWYIIICNCLGYH